MAHAKMTPRREKTQNDRPIDLQEDDTAKLHFRDELRAARYAALANAEDFDQIIHVVERLGSYLSQKVKALGQYEEVLTCLASKSPLALEVPANFPDLHCPFSELYDLVRNARNDVMHQGAFARHLTAHAVELAIVLEDALMNGSQPISHFMVKRPECACKWQPLSFIRQVMLANSFTYLPVNAGTEQKPEWRLISDCLVAKYVRSKSTNTSYLSRLMTRLEEAFTPDQLLKPRVLEASTPITKVLESHDHLPVLVTTTVKSGGVGDSSNREELIGILTAFDVL